MARLPEYMQSKTAWSLLGTRVGIYRISQTSVAELNNISLYILRDIINLANSYRIGADRITLTLDDVQRALLKRNTPIYAGYTKQQYDEALPFARCEVFRGFIKNEGLRRKILSQSNCFYLVPTKLRRMIRFVLDNTNAYYVRFGNLVARMLQLYVEHKMGEVLLLANIMAIDQKRQTITSALLKTAFMKIWRKYNLKDIHWRTLPSITGTITKPEPGAPITAYDEEEEEEEEEEFEDEDERPAPPPPIDGDQPPFDKPKLPKRKKKGRKPLFDDEKKAAPPAAPSKFVPFHYPKLTPTPWIGEYQPLRPELKKPPIIPPVIPKKPEKKPIKPGEPITYPILKPTPWIGEYQPLKPKRKPLKPKPGEPITYPILKPTPWIGEYQPLQPEPRYPFDKPRLPKRRKKRKKPLFEEEVIEEKMLPITLPKKKPIKKKPLPITLPKKKPFKKPRLPKRRPRTRYHIIEREEEKMPIEPETKTEEEIPIEEWPEISAIPPYLPPIPDYEPPLPPGPRRIVKPKRRLPPKPAAIPAIPPAQFRFDRTELKQIEDDMKDQGIGFKFDTSQIESLEEKRNAQLEASRARDFAQSLVDLEEAKQMDEIFRRIDTEEKRKEFEQEIEDRIVDDVRREEEMRKKRFNDKIAEYEAKNNDDLRVLADELQNAKIKNDEIAAELERLAREQEKAMDKIARDYIAKEELIKKQIEMQNKIIDEFYKFTDEEESLLNEDIAEMKRKKIHELNIIADELQAAKIREAEKKKILNDEAIKTLLFMEDKKRRMAEQKRRIIRDEMRKLELQMERQLRKQREKEKQDVKDEIKRTEALIAEFERQKKIAEDKKNKAKIISKSRELVAVKRSVVDLRDYLEDIIMREEEFVVPKLPKRRKKKREHLFPPPPPPIPFIVEQEEERAVVRKRGQKRRATVPVEEAEYELMERPEPIHQKRRRIAKPIPKKKKPKAIEAPIIQKPFVKPKLPRRKTKKREHLFPPPPPPIPFIVEQEEERAMVRKRGQKRRATVPVEEAEYELMERPEPIHEKRRKIEEVKKVERKKVPKSIKAPPKKLKEKPSLRSRRAQAAFEAKLLRQANDLIKKQEKARKKRDKELKEKRDEIMERSKQISAAEKKEKKDSKKAEEEGKEDEHLARQRKIDAFMLQQLDEIDNLQNDMDEVVRKEAKVQEQIERKKKKIDKKVLDRILKFRRPPIAERRPRSVSRSASRSIRQKKKTKARIDKREKELAATREKVLARGRQIREEQRQLKKMATEKFGPPARYPRKPKSRKKLIEYTKEKRPKAFKRQKRKREVAFSPERLPIEPKKEKRAITWIDIERKTRPKKKPTAVVLKSRQSYQEQERLLANDERLLKDLLEDINERTRELEARRPGERRKGIRTAPIPVEKAELESREQLGIPAQIKRQKKAIREKWKPLEEFEAHEKFIREQKALKSQKKFARIKQDIERRARRRRKKKKK